jgi:hypothetical protein
MDQLLDRIVVIAAPFPVIAIVPDVLADADAEPPAADVEHLRAVKRLEVAILVEDVVGGEQRLAEARIDAAAAQQRGAVEQRPPFVGRVRFRKADEHRRKAGGLAREIAEHVPAAADKVAVEQQIARQIADQRQLGRDRQRRVGLAGDSERVQNKVRVACEIADGRVYLKERDFHSTKRRGDARVSARRTVASIVVRSLYTGITTDRSRPVLIIGETSTVPHHEASGHSRAELAGRRRHGAAGDRRRPPRGARRVDHDRRTGADRAVVPPCPVHRRSNSPRPP